MKSMIALAAVIALAAPAGARAPAPNYFVKLTLTEGDRLIATPSAMAASGDMAGFSGGNDTRYDVHFVATPDPSRAGNIRLQLSISLENGYGPGERWSRKATTVLSVIPRGVVVMKMPQTDGQHNSKPFRIDVRVDPVAPSS